MRPVVPPRGPADWLGLTPDPLSVGDVHDWAVQPDCGAVVVFTGTVRDHAEGRPDVSSLEYEAYEQEVTRRLEAIAGETRRRWPAVGRLAMLHSTGRLGVGECSVVVAVSTPHRDDAFAAGRYCIDTLKRTVPIWKRETWAGGDDWGLDAHEIDDVTEVPT